MIVRSKVSGSAFPEPITGIENNQKGRKRHSPGFYAHPAPVESERLQLTFLPKLAILLLVFVAGSLMGCQREQVKIQKPSAALDSLTGIHWVWEDSFSLAEKEKLRFWIEHVLTGTRDVFGPFPFDLTVYFYRSDQATEPVPWAHTRRNNEQEVHFYVNTDFDLKDFLDDWTAPHEISHVSIPYLGKELAWFAEGYATYMQCQVMEAMKVVSPEEVRAKYRDKIGANIPHYAKSPESFIKTANRLVKENHLYPAMYWGSVSFFIRWDQRLQQEEGYGLNQLIRNYQTQGRLKDDDLESMLNTLDSLAGKPYAVDLLEIYSTGPAARVFEGLEL